MSLLLILGGFSLLLPYSINVNMDSLIFFLYHYLPTLCILLLTPNKLNFRHDAVQNLHLCFQMLSAALLTDDKQVSPGLSVLKTYQSSAVRWVFARPLMLLFQHFKISQNIENIFVLACITTIDSLMLQVD